MTFTTLPSGSTARCAILRRRLARRCLSELGVICFTSQRRVRHRRLVRMLLLLTALMMLSVFAASAQDQEKKLLDRLLHPDMSLLNPAQDKQFTADNTTATKQARTRPFYVIERRRDNEFNGSRNYRAKEFETRASQYDGVQANLKPRNHITREDIPYSASSYADAKPALSVDKAREVSEFPGTRPFLVRGKSQKALSAQDRPLTIDQVRELLNKNK